MNNNTNTGKLKLTPQQRKSLFAGNAPSISGEGPCPVAPGYVYRLSERLTLEVEVVRHPAPDKWTLLYCVKDKRDPVRKLRRVPPVHVDDADSTVPTEDALKDAAEESAYTSMPSSLSDAGEAPPRAVVDAYALRASQQDAARRQTEWEHKTLADWLKDLEDGMDYRDRAATEKLLAALARKQRGKAA